MKNINYKTFRFKNISINIINNDITVIYKTKSNVHIKTFYKDDFLSVSNKYIYGLIFLILIIPAVYFLNQSISQNHDNSVNIESDDEKKDMLLLSDKTDFSAQNENETLSLKEHIVQKNETLSEIAKLYGVSMDTICGSNTLQSYDVIKEGYRLKIPNKDGILHKVKKGDSVLSIANKYRTSIQKIYAENILIKNLDFISEGDMLFVPDAKPLDIFPGFLMPVHGAVTSSFGWRTHPVFGDKRFHLGTDVRANYQLVRATKYGKVTFCGWLGGYGKAIIIAHPGGWKSLYGHLSRYIVKTGQYVKQGQYIAKSGNTGYTTGPHLHFELMKNGSHKNPVKLLKAKK